MERLIVILELHASLLCRRSCRPITANWRHVTLQAKKVKPSPLTGRGGPWDCETLRLVSRQLAHRWRFCCSVPGETENPSFTLETNLRLAQRKKRKKGNRGCSKKSFTLTFQILLKGYKFRSYDHLPPEDCHTTETCSGYSIKYSKQCCVRREPCTWRKRKLLNSVESDLG
jgi:hypothetical protein